MLVTSSNENFMTNVSDIFKGVNNRHNYFLDSKTNGGLCGLHLAVNEEYFLIGMLDLS